MLPGIEPRNDADGAAVPAVGAAEERAGETQALLLPLPEDNTKTHNLCMNKAAPPATICIRQSGQYVDAGANTKSLAGLLSMLSQLWLFFVPPDNTVAKLLFL